MFKEWKGKKLIIGLVHLLPMPGTPFYKEGDFERSIEKAVKDSLALVEGGAGGCLVQAVDKVYTNLDDTDYARVSCITRITSEVRRAVPKDFMVGVQLTWNCITPSLAAAIASGADFTRCTALIGKTESPFGTVEANPMKVMEYRRKIGAEKVDMIAELAGYHFHGAYDKSALQTNAKSALNVGANAVELLHPDEEINNQMVQDVKASNPDISVILGGGTNVENASRRLKYADAALVGACFENNNWGGNIDPETVKRYMAEIAKI